MGFDTLLPLPWTPMNTQVTDIAVAPDDELVWGIRVRDGSLVQWNSANGLWSSVKSSPTGLARIALGGMADAFKETLVRVPRGASPFGARKPARYRVAWALRPNGEILRTAADGWQSVSGSLTRIACAADNAAVGINAEGRMYEWTHNGFQPLDDQPRWRDVTVGERGNVVGMLREGVSTLRYNGASWSPLPRDFVHAAMDAAGSLFGPVVGKIASLCTTKPTPALVHDYESSVEIVRVAMGATSLWGMDASGNVYRTSR